MDSEHDEAVPGANREFLEQYEMTFRLRSEQVSIGKILNRLVYSTPPGGALVMLVLDRLEKPTGHVKVEFSVLCCAVRTDVDFVKKNEGGEQ